MVLQKPDIPRPMWAFSRCMVPHPPRGNLTLCCNSHPRPQSNGDANMNTTIDSVPQLYSTPSPLTTCCLPARDHKKTTMPGRNADLVALRRPTCGLPLRSTARYPHGNSSSCSSSTGGGVRGSSGNSGAPKKPSTCCKRARFRVAAATAEVSRWYHATGKLSG